MRFACQLSTSSDIILVRFFVISYVIKREEEKICFLFVETCESEQMSFIRYVIRFLFLYFSLTINSYAKTRNKRIQIGLFQVMSRQSFSSRFSFSLTKGFSKTRFDL